MLLLFYGAVCSGLISGYMLKRLRVCFEPMLDPRYFLEHDLLVIIAYILCFLLFVALSSFFIFNFKLMMNAMTTIEYKEKLFSKLPLITHSYSVAHIKFDFGTYGNLVHMMGPVWSWLLPLHPRPEDDGTYWGEHKQDSEGEHCC